MLYNKSLCLIFPLMTSTLKHSWSQNGAIQNAKYYSDRVTNYTKLMYLGSKITMNFDTDSRNAKVHV